ncbi:hypothetical protein [Streptomyces avicenniae]|uniref:hypothetical protein n=1 Tax=Streptomyces avicenniae TaxID=500153 RepID=UPI00069AE535|nr:hypothetical protein [Streptomyces avicenniae]
MGWPVLYIAFGVVALWLLGEVLLQYKARLRWRLLAFCGFLLVVLGGVFRSVPVIALGTIAFAVGQTFVTLSFRRGFSTGWALGGRPGTSRRRRAVRPMEPVPDADGGDTPPPDATPVDGVPQVAHAYADAPDDGYGDADSTQLQARVPADDEEGHAAPGPSGEEIYAGAADTPYGDPYLGGYAPATPDYDAPSTVYDVHDTGENYAAYQDPYLDPATAYQDQSGAHQQAPDPYAAQYGGDYAAQGGWTEDGGPSSGQWQTAGQYYQETPPGGVWVPQQRDSAQQGADETEYGYPAAQQDASYPTGNGYDSSGQGYYYSDNDQHRS